MDALLTALRAAAEPTRLRLLALASRGAFCVSDLTEILGQSQPRLSRHLKLLCEARLLAREREGVNVRFTVAPGEGGSIARDLIRRLPDSDPVLVADRRHAARVLAERAREASQNFHRQGADWDEMRALGLPAVAVEAALLALLPHGPIDRLVDIGTGTGRLLELLSDRARDAVGVDASPAMLALARARLGRAGLDNCVCRLADMYRLPFADASFDVAVTQMVLHHAEEPAGVLAEAARVLRPGGVLVVADLAPHPSSEITERLAHRWPGFSDETLTALLAGAGFRPGPACSVAGPLEVRLWSARLPAGMATGIVGAPDQPHATLSL